MGTLSRPGPPVAAVASLPPQGRAQPFSQWFPEFLRDELSPYPGRTALVLRMTLAATLTMLAIMTFRLPGAAIAAYYTLLLSRDSPVMTARTAATVLISYLLGASFSLLCVILFIDYPLTHFLWVTLSIFLCFFVIKVTTNYTGGAAFAFIITIVIPIWDTPAPTAILVTATLWAAGSVSVGLLCTIAVEYLFALARENRNELHTGLATRTAAVSAFLRSYARKAPDLADTGQKVQQLAMVGVSRLRRLASRPATGGSPERRSTTVSLVGRIVDIAAALQHVPSPLSEESKRRLDALAQQLDFLEPHLGAASPRAKVPTPTEPGGHPLLSELERTVRLLQLSLSAGSLESLLPLERPADSVGNTLLPDAFTNPDHLIYSLRGCLAAMLCYVILNAIAWRGLSTALATCAVTALSSVGASRQKQILRMSGALVGGLLFGIGSQVLILPMLDSIAGFAVLFAVVTAIAAWFGTSSPRLSYFGQQIALAFFLINLQEPYPQLSLAVARDRVMGIALGLLMMWLVFDQLGSRPAAQVMRDLFATNLRLLSELARPWRHDKPVDLQHLRPIRDRLSTNFASVNAQGDAVLFELGPTRQRDLQLRDHLLAWQPRLRTVFLVEIALVQYRAHVRPDELAPEILRAQSNFDERASELLRSLADSFETRRPCIAGSAVKKAYEDLEQAIRGAYHNHPTPRAQGVLAFSANLADLLNGLSQEFAQAAALIRPQSPAQVQPSQT